MSARRSSPPVGGRTARRGAGTASSAACGGRTARRAAGTASSAALGGRTARRAVGTASSAAWGGRARGVAEAAARAEVGAARPEVEVAVVLDLLDAACLAGASIPASMAAVGGAVGGVRGAALTRAAGALGLGAPWDEAWAGADVAMLPARDALRPGWVDGAPPGGTLRALAGTLRRERRARAMEAAGALGVRLVVPLAVCHLPAFVLVGLVPVLISVAAAGAR